MMIIKYGNDNRQVEPGNGRLFSPDMIFSKSFGYALRALLYVALINKTKAYVQLDEIAGQLALPRHFLGKIMNKLSNEGILNSVKGPYGGFSITEITMHTTLIEIMVLTGETEDFESCVLRLRKCNSINPCPLHNQIESMKKEWYELVSNTTLMDLLNENQPNFIRSIATI